MDRYCRTKINTNELRKQRWKTSKLVLKIAASYHSLAGLILPKLKTLPGSVLQLILRSLANTLGGIICSLSQVSVILLISDTFGSYFNFCIHIIPL